jgi:hypothetical protein
MTLLKNLNFRIALCVSTAIVGIVAAGCEPADANPQQKVDAPGYYNGPVKPKGGAETGQTDAAKPKMDPE